MCQIEYCRFFSISANVAILFSQGTCIGGFRKLHIRRRHDEKNFQDCVIGKEVMKSYTWLGDEVPNKVLVAMCLRKKAVNSFCQPRD
jgi:hypothetical protein